MMRWVVLILVVVLIVTCGILSDGSDGGSGSTSESRAISLEVIGESVVKQYLKSPSSAKFSGFPEIRHDPDTDVYFFTGTLMFFWNMR